MGQIRAVLIIVDPVKIDPGASTTIDFYVPSPDGSLVAVSLSVGGSESGDVHVYSVKTGEQIGNEHRRSRSGESETRKNEYPGADHRTGRD